MAASIRDRLDLGEVDLNPFDDPSATQYRVGFFKAAKLVYKRFGSHNVTVIAAGIAFYALLALLPTLIAMVSLYSLVNDPAEILAQVNDFAATLDPDTRDLVNSFGEAAVGEVDTEGGASVGRIAGLAIGILVALYSASGAVQKLMNIVNAAYEAKETRPGLLLRGLAFLFTALAILFVVLLIGLLGVIPVLAERADLGNAAEVAVNVLTYVGLALAFPFALTVLYRYSPDRERLTPWRNRGSVVATVLWVISAVAFSIYARNIGSFGAAYALIGAIAGLIIFFQLTAISIIIGAETNAVLENPANSMIPEVSARAAAGGPSIRSGPQSGSVSRLNATAKRSQKKVPVPAEPIGFGKALAGLVALFLLGRNS